MGSSQRRPLRLVLGSEETGDPPQVASHASRNGSIYYLHQGVTKTGKPRYFVRKSIGDGALEAMPAGFEFCESLNGVVSVRRCRGPSSIPDADVELVRAELVRHAHLRDHQVELRDDRIVVFEPEGPARPLSELAEFARRLGIDRSAGVPSRRRFAPVMLFDLAVPGSREYCVMRMTYRGEGGWLTFDIGPLKRLVRHLKVLGTDAFFELF